MTQNVDATNEFALHILKSLYRPNPRWQADQLEALEDAAFAKGKTKEEVTAYLDQAKEFTDVSMNSKIEAIFTEWTGQAWSDKNGGPQTPMLGINNQETISESVYLSQAQKVSDALGMDFIQVEANSPKAEASLKVFQFLKFDPLPITGQIAPETISNLAADLTEEQSDQLKEQVYTGLYQLLTKSRQAGASVVYVDNLGNIPAVAVNVILKAIDPSNVSKMGTSMAVIGNAGVSVNSTDLALADSFKQMAKMPIIQMTDSVSERLVSRRQQFENELQPAKSSAPVTSSSGSKM